MRQVHSENSFSYDSWVMIQLPHLMLAESLKVAFNKPRKLHHFYVSREAAVARRNLDGVHSWCQVYILIDGDLKFLEDSDASPG